MGRLDGRVAAVTGGAAGIGEAIVKLFADEGASVGFADLDGGRGATVLVGNAAVALAKKRGPKHHRAATPPPAAPGTPASQTRGRTRR